MARIIHVANFSFRAKGAFLHSVAPKLSNGFIRNGHSVINFSDRDMARAGSILGHRQLGYRHANRALSRLCEDARPDLLVLGHADVIAAETLARIRGRLPGLRILQWNVDPLFEPDNVRRIEAKLGAVDMTLVSTAGPSLEAFARRTGSRFGFLPNPVDASVETARNFERADLAHDLFYVCGTGGMARATCGGTWQMDALLREIAARLPGLDMMLGGCMGRPHLTGAAYQAALASARLGLNISRRNDVALYSSDRLAHMIGNGQAILIERATGYDGLFDDDAMAFFSTLDELTGRIERLCADDAERRTLAAKGHARYAQLFNERRIAGYLVDAAFDRVDPRGYEWPTLI